MQHQRKRNFPSIRNGSLLEYIGEAKVLKCMGEKSYLPISRGERVTIVSIMDESVTLACKKNIYVIKKESFTHGDFKLATQSLSQKARKARTHILKAHN